MMALPTYITKYFWGDDLAELSWEKHQKYITETILNKGDAQASGWLLRKVARDTLRSDLSHYKLDKKSLNFWEFYLA